MWDLSSWAQSLGLGPAVAAKEPAKASSSPTAQKDLNGSASSAEASNDLTQSLPFERLSSTGNGRIDLIVDDLPDDIPIVVDTKQTPRPELLAELSQAAAIGAQAPTELLSESSEAAAIGAQAPKASSSTRVPSKGRLPAPKTLRSVAQMAKAKARPAPVDASFESSASRPITQSFESTGSGSTSMASSLMSPPASVDFTDALAAARSKVVGSTSTATSSVRKSSDFDASCNACILYDWDDTLCPSTWAFAERAKGVVDHQQLGARFGGELEALAAITELVLRESRKVARVAIITLADKDWFQESCQLFYPGVHMQKLLQELGVKIYFANKPADEQDTEEQRVAAKKKAMEKCLATLYPFLSKRTVKWNVLCIGDALTEHQALKQALAVCSPSAGSICKTLKFADKPSLERLNAQLQSLPPHLERMIAEKKDFDRNSALLWIGGKKG